MDFYKSRWQTLTVIHDDIDLAPAKLGVKVDGGHGGHNGLRDIDRHLRHSIPAVPDWRWAIAACETGQQDGRQPCAVQLHHRRTRHNGLDPLLDCMARHLDLLLAEDDNEFMTTVARHCPPPKQQDTSDGI